MPQGHKWTHYFETYQTIFGSRRNTPMRILEIGVLQGASLRLWKSYFQNANTSVVGVDIDPACARFDTPSNGIHVRIGSQVDSEFLASVVNEFGPFDLIIDDGSHHSTHMIKSLNCLFAAGLKDDGIYFVEDLHANYWLPKTPLSAWGEELQSGSNLALEVPEITTIIKEIRFFDSIVAIYKTRRLHAPRYIIA
jgi:hypothetical protein